MTEPTRRAPPGEFQADGSCSFCSTLSPKANPVRAAGLLPPDKVIPIIFVPGIMGSNLRNKTPIKDDKDLPWRPPNGLKEKGRAVAKWKDKLPHQRQLLLDPNNTELDTSGPVAVSEEAHVLASDARKRGWGGVHLESYGGILNFLQEHCNQTMCYSPESNKSTVLRLWERLMADDDPNWGKMLRERLTVAELQCNCEYHFPVYAFGYNWLRSNGEAAQKLSQRIDAIRNEWTSRNHFCQEVILVTHSMGGLVARACSKQRGGANILGVIHGVQPALGAPAAYRRIACGTEKFSPSNDGIENLAAEGFSKIAGPTAAETTPVMATSPGPLELLPNHLYPGPWLFASHWPTRGVKEKVALALPKADPYSEIYAKDARTCWYAPVNSALIDPAKTYNNMDQADPLLQSPWSAFSTALKTSQTFHKGLGTYYHPRTYAYYGADKTQLAYGAVSWQSNELANEEDSTRLVNAPLYKTNNAGYRVASLPVDAALTRQIQRATGQSGPLPGDGLSFQVLWQNVPGDGTVPEQSGEAPKGKQGVRACWKLSGFDHQGSYNDDTVRLYTLWAITKLVQEAK